MLRFPGRNRLIQTIETDYSALREQFSQLDRYGIGQKAISLDDTPPILSVKGLPLI